MRKHRPRPRALASALAVASLLAGALLAVGNASASIAYPAGAAHASGSRFEAAWRQADTELHLNDL